MRKTLLGAAALFSLLTTGCSAQSTSHMVSDISYYTAAADKKTLELKTDHDSLVILRKNGDIPDRQQNFTIVDREKRGEYYLLYVKRDSPAPRPSKWQLPTQRPYGLFVLLFSPDKEQLHVLQESKMAFATLDEVRQANTRVSFGDKYFYTWYAPDLFSSLIRLPSIATTDKTTMQKVVDMLVDEMKSNLPKRRNSGQSDYYGTGYLQDNLNKALIAGHISPITNMQEVNDKITQYNLTLPQFPPMTNQSNPLNSDTSHMKAPSVHH